MAIDNAEIGKRIRMLRISRNMTIEDLSIAVSCSYDHLQKAEKGKRGLSIDTLDQIHECFDVSMDELLYGTDNFYSL